MDAGTFSLVPLEVIQDKRLTLWQIRVLVALFSFRNKNTDTVWPSRAAISERSGMHPSNISAATTALVELGWLKKDGVGGHSKASRYTITTPDLSTVAESTTVAANATVAKSTTVAANATVAKYATSTVAESTTSTVASAATRKEHTKEHTKEQTTSEAPSAPAAPAPSAAPAMATLPAEPAAAKPARTRKPKAEAVPADETELQAACRATWAAYCQAYATRHGVAPIRNAKVNAAVKGFVQRIGYEESPAVAEFYVASVHDAYIVRQMHDVTLLLKGAEGYRTQWATGRAVTATTAKQADQTAANYSTIDQAKAFVRARRAARAAGEDVL